MIEGKNIILRTMREDELDYYIKMMGDVNEVGDFSNVIVMSKTNILKDFRENGFWSRDFGRLVIADKSDKMLGFISFFKGSPYMKGYEIGYQIFRRSDRGKGYTSEALKIFSAYLFEIGDFNRLQICMEKENIGSVKVAEKCGYSREGTLRGILFEKGNYCDLEIYSMLRSECPSLKEVLSSL